MIKVCDIQRIGKLLYQILLQSLLTEKSMGLGCLSSSFLKIEVTEFCFRT